VLKQVGVGIIWDQHKLLIDRRLPTGTLPGVWEFPGGKLEPGESAQDCIVREIFEELGLKVTVGEELMIINHSYPTFDIQLIVHHCQYLGGVPQLLACDEVRWVTVTELSDYEIPAANAAIVDKLQALPLPSFDQK
jgi:8-oxo-dGTP diphosphatase